MTFTPILTGAGYSGWTFLKRTLATQQASFDRSPEIKRDIDYFAANIGKVSTADQLVGDRRLLKVALGAFGLDNDIDSKAFLKKILSDGAVKTDALANKLADKSYLRFAAAFGFGGTSAPRTQLSSFASEITSAYEQRQFEAAVGEQDNSLRLALNAQREIPALGAKASSEDTKWYTILGNTPMRTVMQAALGLPDSTANLDVDQQLTMFKDRASKIFGSDSVKQFTDATKMETLVRRYLVKTQADQIKSTTSSFALDSLTQTRSMMRSWRF
jgi:hypothetical protein